MFDSKKNVKYKITKEFITLEDGVRVYRIKALRDFGDVKRGELGGYIASESNLSHNGDCWVYSGAIVHGCARVRENAKVRGRARVSGFCIIGDNSIIGGNSVLSGDVECNGHTSICGESSLGGEVFIYDAYVYDGDIAGYSESIFIRGGRFTDSPSIRSNRHHFIIGPLGSRNDFTTIYRDIDRDIIVTTGCFIGTLEEFEEAVNEEHGDNRYAREYKTLIELAKIHISKLDDPDEGE